MFGSLILANHFLISLHPSKQLLHVVANHLYGRWAYSYHVLVWSLSTIVMMHVFILYLVNSKPKTFLNFKIHLKKKYCFVDEWVGQWSEAKFTKYTTLPSFETVPDIIVISQTISSWSILWSGKCLIDLREMLCLWWGRRQLEDSCKTSERFYGSTIKWNWPIVTKNNHFSFFGRIVNELDRLRETKCH